MTLLEAVSAKGAYTAPMIIASGKLVQERWFDSDIPRDTVLGVSESGYINDELALEWIQHLERTTSPRRPGNWRLPIYDNFGSHSFKEFLTFAREQKIVVLVLPAHTSHFLQPLDVVLFQPYKHYHRRAIADATRTGCTDFGITTFLGALSDIRTKTFTERNIRKAFKKSGIWPIDPQLILQFLRLQYGIEDPERDNIRRYITQAAS